VPSSSSRRTPIGKLGITLGIALVASLLLVSGTAPARADTPVRHQGTTGYHRLVDAESTPGAGCRYDPISGRVTGIRVPPPVVLAVDRTARTDSQVVAIVAVVQRRRDAGTWHAIAISEQERAIATDTRSPFQSPVSFTPEAGGRYRVRWKMSWYGSDGARTGYAVHEVDYYRIGYGRVRIGVQRGSCPATVAGTSSVLVSHGPRYVRQVALTLDMGGRMKPAEQIMGWLVDHEIPATIFPTGSTGSTTAAGRRVLGIIREHANLFGLGNHSWDHPRCTRLTPAQVDRQLRRTEDAVAPLAGQSTRPWFRPPYGAVDQQLLDAVGASGWAITVKWDVTTNDYVPPDEGGPTTDELVDRILSRVRGGSIVLLHLGGYRTRQALPAIVAGIRERGLELVTLDRLLGIEAEATHGG
jgi:peptidoglycan/xylan/chitin deacetylase (PgdA/CDA1 family)